MKYNFIRQRLFGLCAGILFFISQARLNAQTETISTQFNQASAATDPCGTTEVQIYGFSYNVTSGTATFTAINGFTTSGTYLASDILNYKLWQTNFSVFNTTNLLASLPASGPGAHTFNGFSFGMTAPVTRYFWITVDLSATAVNARTITCNVITAAMTAITGTESFGTNTAGGTQTISCSGLPIELLSFTGSASPEGNILKWTTATETNNDFFTLERSSNGISFQKCAIIDGAGTSNQTNNYRYMDLSFAPGIVYYRLKQTDFDGQSQFSEMIAINNSIIPVGIRVFPDPATDKLNVVVPLGNSELFLEIYDIHGKQLRNMFFNSLNGGTVAIFDISDLGPGIYFVEWNGIHQKFIKQ